MAKGHSPNITDNDIKQAAGLMNDMDAGASIPLNEIPAIQWTMMKRLKNSIQKHRQKEMQKTSR